MKIDKQLKDLSERLHDISNGNGNDDYHDNYGLTDEHDDESYPPRFTYYRHVRWEKLDDSSIMLTLENVR